MSESLNNNRAAVGDAGSVSHEMRGKLTASPTEARIRHVYVHIPFCARICPYCAFYKELLDRSQTERFCQALLMELRQHDQGRAIFQSPRRFGNRRSLSLAPTTIYFGGGTPTALTTRQLEFLLGGFGEALD